MKIAIYITAILVLVQFSSCKKGFLDQVPNDRLTLDETFSNRQTAEKFLNNIYNNIPDEFGQRNPGGDRNAGLWTAGSDEAEFLWGGVQSNSLNIGNWDATSGFVNDYWRNYYRGIRSATFFMANIDRVKELSPMLKNQYRAEARALRGMFYFYLVRLYGPVILMGDVIIEPDAPASEVQLARSSMDECIAYISKELEEVAEQLPVTPANDDSYGRITQGIVLAFRAQALLLNASPLFNGNADLAGLQNKDGKQLISSSFDAGKWAAAATAYKSFISKYVPGTYDLFRKNDANGNFDPYLSCRDMFLTDWNKEVILARPESSLSARQYEMTPYHSGYPREVKGAGALGATQGQVDAFFMANGKNISDAGSGYLTTGFAENPTKYTSAGIYNQWVGREPRFYVNITFNGSTWLNTNEGQIITELYNTGNSGKATGGNDYCPTGYIVRKAMGLGNWDVDRRPVILYRLANIFLDYAEAVNEAEPGSGEAIKYVNLIRERAGIPVYGSADLALPAGQSQIRDAIRKERRSELAFENVRFFDTRRWKIAEQTDNGPMKGLDIGKNLPGFLNVITFETRVFTKRHYLFPIPSNDVNVDAELIQNPGW